MEILYCSDPLNPKQSDMDYAHEEQTAREYGLSTHLISYEKLVEYHNPIHALKAIPASDEPRTAIYRGWMMTPDEYTCFYTYLSQKGVRLINSPEEYTHCHYLPESYDLIKAHTPRSVWLSKSDGLAIEHIMKALSVFGHAPLIVKDYVKSHKHYWREACYIPHASDQHEVERVVTRFLELRGEPEGGLVFREFLEFQSIGSHSQSGMPLTCEFRLFFLDKKPIMILKYWEEGHYDDVIPPVEIFTAIASQIKSHFFTMDIAKSQRGEWLIVELGDGQVAGFPEHADMQAFYREISSRG